MKPFAPGDIFLGCTYLCNPDDDHAGEGRILQYDRNMVPKGTLYTEGTTHLVVNLRFGPDGVLWGFDAFAHAVVRVATMGVAYLKNGILCLLRGSFIDFIDADGNSLRTIELDEYGYAMIALSDDDRFAYVTNIFTGVMSKVDLASGDIVGAIDTGMARPSRSLAGVAVYPG